MTGKLQRALLGAVLAFAVALPAAAQDKKTILTSVPSLNFPFFVHMLKAMKAEVEKLGVTSVEIRWPEQRAEADRRCRGGDHEEASTASSSARSTSTPWRRRCSEAVDANVPVVTIDRRVTGVDGHPRPCRGRQRQGRRGPGRNG